VALVALAYLVWAVATLIRPDWGRFRPVVRVAADLAILGIAVYLLQAGQWIVPAPTSGQADNTLATINQYMRLCLLPVTIGVVIVTLIDGWRLLRHGRPRSA
jgi:hypothetical protein